MGSLTLLSNSKRLVPPALTPIVKRVYHGLFRLHLRARIWYADRAKMPDLDVPVPPAMLRFRISESLSVPEFLRVGEASANLIRQLASDMGVDLADTRRVLDFGCGSGRTIRWFLTGAAAEFHGVDVDAEAVAWCSGHLPRGHFLATAAVPPLPYLAEHFDFIYCISVFTHLDESMQDSWLAELRRILKPGAVLLLTTYGAAAVEHLSAEDRAVLQKCGFIHKRSQKLKGLSPDWYQTSWHSRDYIDNRLSVGFEDIRHHVIPGAVQEIVVARKTCS